MRIDQPLHSSEQVLINSLTPDQIMAVAEWLGVEKNLRARAGQSQPLKETLESMANRLRSIAPQGQHDDGTSTKRVKTRGPKGYPVQYLELL